MTPPKDFTLDEIITAYNDAVGYLISEETTYDRQGNYKEARMWLANKLDKEIDKYMSKVDGKK